MNYLEAENQVQQSQQQFQTVIQQFQNVAQKVRAAAPDEATGREWAMDLREIALAVQSQNQATVALVQQMAEYIRTLETQLDTHPNPTVQPRGWNRLGASSSGGGFLGNLTAGLGMGAGFAVAEDVVNDLFSAF
ncbi:MAG TPA: hypothetical protein DEP05_07655 [Betaproteobacteria bacterium]|nr:hypothetical protein [Betaproteobacteria bacterium]